MGCGSSGLGDQVLVADPQPMKLPMRALPQDAPSQQAVALFNGGNPKAALETLGLDGNPKAAASWLHRTQGLDCTVLGDILGDFKYTALRQAYIQAFAFTGVSLEVALRSLLRNFRLPGEAQKIDRLMESFASHWCACHKEPAREAVPEQQLSPDGAFLVSFALIMLNTDLHNASVKRKMSLEQFQRAVRSAEGGQELPKSWIRQLYRNIRDHEIVMECQFTSPQMPCINPEAFDEWLENLQGSESESSNPENDDTNYVTI